MSYCRPKPKTIPKKTERLNILRVYYEYYETLAKSQPSALNQKIPRTAFASLMDRIGEILVIEATDLATKPGQVREFLDNNPVPDCFKDSLPDDFRTFCLIMNSLKQWVSAEQAATDRYLLGGRVREECRTASTHS